MKCNEVRKNLNRYLDREIPEEDQIRIREHLSTCGKCSAEYAQLLSLQRFLLADPILDVPSHIHERILSQIRERKERKPLPYHLGWRLIPVAASILMSMYFGVFFGMKTLPLTYAKSELTEMSELSLGQETLLVMDEGQEF